MSNQAFPQVSLIKPEALLVLFIVRKIVDSAKTKISQACSPSKYLLNYDFNFY